MPYRLLSESEWEYVARGGTRTLYWWGDRPEIDHANYDASSLGKTSEVDRYPPNPFGVYDNLGNVWEWVADSFQLDLTGAPVRGEVWNVESDRKVVRGGCWYYDAAFITAHARLGMPPDTRFNSIGFRVCRPLAERIVSGSNYHIVSGVSGHLLSVADDGTHVTLLPDLDRSQERVTWVVSTAGNDESWSIAPSGDPSMKLSVSQASGSNYADIIVESAATSSNNRWRIAVDPRGCILAVEHSGKVLDIDGAESGPAANAIQFTFHGNYNQRWWLQLAHNFQAA
jgi:hypothetical protein